MNLDFWISVAVLAGIYGIFTLGLQLNAGLTGILNFGQAGFMTIGAYTFGLLVAQAAWNGWAAAVAALVAAVVAALLVGLSSLRLRTDYFAIATIAFAEMVRYTLQNAEFSGGNQGVLGYDGAWRDFAEKLSRGLGEAGLVLLDEPMAGINPTLGRQLLDHIDEVRRRDGCTFLFVEHDMDVVMTRADHVIVMAHGTVVARGTPSQIRDDPRVIDAYLGDVGAEALP